MSMLLIAFLVASPFEIPVPNAVPESLFDSLKDVAMILELSGPHCNWNVHSFRSEVRWVREQFRECRDYPPLRDAARLPPRDECLRIYAEMWRQQLSLLEAARCERLHWAERLEQPIREARRAREFWQVAAEATDEQSMWCRRRAALDELRRMIGDEAYLKGEWP